MAVLKKYNLAGQQVGEVALEDAWTNADKNLQMIKDYLIALRANARQWSANTKGRSEVSHSTKKPHPQKGTGRARQGTLAAPQYKGGGRVHTPKPKFDQHVRVNKKEKRAAICHLLSEKIVQNSIVVLSYESLKEPKTKKVHSFLKGRDVLDQRILFLGENPGEASSEKYDFFIKSMQNIPKTQFKRFSNMSGYDIAISQQVVVMEDAVEDLVNLLKSGS